MANALDRASTASLVLGVFAPVAASFYGSQPGSEIDLETLAIGAAIWLGASIALHMAARRILGKLRL
ncbi:MAG: hypothetical protein H0T75_19965 [Rhizobiales bacterium]|nr:hypothetical protein [Hyphomicrobiales bacterium]